MGDLPNFCYEHDNYSLNASLPTNMSEWDPQDYFESWQYRGLDILERYVFVSLFCIGLVTNLLCIIVLQTSDSYQNKSTTVLMTVLALADCGVLLTSDLELWTHKLIAYDVRSLNDLSCQFHTFFTYYFTQLSAWTLVLVTIERVVCVHSSHTFNRLFSTRRTVLGWGLIAGILVLLNVIIFDLVEINPCYVNKYGHPVCLYNDTEKWNIYSILDLFLSSVLPFAIVLPGNIFIIVKMSRYVTWRRSLLSSGVGARVQSQHTAPSSTTVMMTVNCIVFIILTAPSAVLFVYQYGRSVSDDSTTVFLDYLFTSFVSLNSCINFLLYSMTSQKFRLAILSLLKIPCTKKKSLTEHLPMKSKTEGRSAYASQKL